jgi:hypothetical protein
VIEELDVRRVRNLVAPFAAGQRRQLRSEAFMRCLRIDNLSAGPAPLVKGLRHAGRWEDGDRVLPGGLTFGLGGNLAALHQEADILGNVVGVQRGTLELVVVLLRLLPVGNQARHRNPALADGGSIGIADSQGAAAGDGAEFLDRQDQRRVAKLPRGDRLPVEPGRHGVAAGIDRRLELVDHRSVGDDRRVFDDAFRGPAAIEDALGRFDVALELLRLALVAAGLHLVGLEHEPGE